MAFIQTHEAKTLFESGFLSGFYVVKAIIGDGWHLRLKGFKSQDFEICTFRERDRRRLFITSDSAIKAATDIGFKVDALELVTFSK